MYRDGKVIKTLINQVHSQYLCCIFFLWNCRPWSRIYPRSTEKKFPENEANTGKGRFNTWYMGGKERESERKKEKTGEGEEWIKEEERKIETGRKSKTEKPRFLWTLHRRAFHLCLKSALCCSWVTRLKIFLLFFSQMKLSICHSEKIDICFVSYTSIKWRGDIYDLSFLIRI